VLRGARPEHAVLGVDLLPRDAGVVGDGAGGGPPQLVPDRAGALERKILPTAEPSREVAEDLPIPLRLPWRCDGAVDLDDAALEVGGRALVLAPDRAGQDHVGALCGLGEKE